MGKVIAYTALIVVCLGLGALAGGLGVYFGFPQTDHQSVQSREASCVPMANKARNDVRAVTGLIDLSQASDMYLEITIRNITGLPVQPKFGFHIHTYGILNDDCASAGSHFNPENQNHGGPKSMDRHVGDLGNFDFAEYNRSSTIYKWSDTKASLFGEDSIIGRSIVIHEREDDLKDVGSAGPRLACCTILKRNKDYDIPHSYPL